jgi:hypothetical protein
MIEVGDTVSYEGVVNRKQDRFANIGMSHGGFAMWVPLDQLTLVKKALPKEPPVGSVVIIKNELGHILSARRIYADVWCFNGSSSKYTWADVVEDREIIATYQDNT